METKNFDELNANPKNPRRITDHDFGSLVDSIREFGDLSGITLNTTSNQLVGGHQRVQAFKKLAGSKHVVITQRLEHPDAKGTVAIGYVVWDNTFFPYREVQWDAAREMAGNIAANRIQGTFDLDLLAEANYMIAQEDASLLKLTGQKDDEIADLLNAVGVGEPDQEPKEPSMVLRVECESDQQMNELYTQLKEQGYNVKI